MISEEVITIGLVDSIIAISRVLAPRLREVDNQTTNVKDALVDLAKDADFQTIDYLSQCMLV